MPGRDGPLAGEGPAVGVVRRPSLTEKRTTNTASTASSTRKTPNITMKATGQPDELEDAWAAATPARFTAEGLSSS